MENTKKIILLTLMLISVIFNTTYAEQKEIVRWGRTNITSSVNVRSGPSIDNTIIGELSPKDIVKVLKIDSDGWYKVLYRGQVSYVYSEYLDTWEESRYKCVGKYKTYFNFDNRNRNHNINLASQQISIRLLPGEYFKWSEVIGPASKEQGYLLGNVIVGNEMVKDYGGGVCQVSSTLYNAALEADMEIIERHTHGLPVTYVPPGRDATVSYGYLDFIFKNSKPYEVQISGFTGNGFVEVSIYNVDDIIKKEITVKKEITTKKQNTVRVNRQPIKIESW